VLAGQANSPGAYSKRTVNFLSGLDKRDAESFTQLCDFAWLIEETTPVIFDEKYQIYNEHGVNFETLSHLEAIGLIKYFPQAEIMREDLPGTFLASYFGTTVSLTTDGGKLPTGKVFLTQIGQELSPICGSKAVPGFFEYVWERWKEDASTKIRPLR